MFRYAFVIVVLFFTFSSYVEAASAKRVALVIGNESYTSLSPLSNPTLDANAIAKVLGGHGFEVKLHKDLDHEEFEEAIADFVSFSQGAEEAVIFYAGHGMGVVEDGRIINALAATDAVMDCRTRSAQNVVALEDVLSRLAHVPKKVALFDACRSDPLPQCSGFGFQAPKLTGSDDNVRSAAPNVQSTRGLAVESTDTQSQVLIGYSSNLGETAQDGEPGQHSPYAKALLAELDLNPKMPFRELLDKTATRVTSLTGSQFPWVVTKGGEPEMCLVGSDCQTSTTLIRETLLEQSQRFAQLSNQSLQDGDSGTAIALALEAFPHDRESEWDQLHDARIALERSYFNLQERNTIAQHATPVTRFLFHPNLPFAASASSDGNLILWNVNDFKLKFILQSAEDKAGSLTPEIYFDGSNSTVIAFTDLTHNVTIWRLSDAKKIYNESFYRAISLDPTGTLVALRTDNEDIEIREAHTGILLKKVPSLLKYVTYLKITDLFFTNDSSSLIIGYEDINEETNKGWFLFNLSNNTIDKLTGTIHKYDPVRNILMTRIENNWIIWDIKNKKYKKIYASQNNNSSIHTSESEGIYVEYGGWEYSSSVIFSNTSKTLELSGRADPLSTSPLVGKNLLLWQQADPVWHLVDIESGKVIATGPGFSDTFAGARVGHPGHHIESTGGRYFATYPPAYLHDSLISVYESKNGTPIGKFTRKGIGVGSVSFSNDEQYVVVGYQDGQIRVYSLNPIIEQPPRERIDMLARILPQIQDTPRVRGYSPDNKYVYLVVRDKNKKDYVVVFDTESAVAILTTTKSEHPIEAAEFTPNSEKIIIEHQVDRERREISFTVWDIRGEKKISEFVPPVKRMYMETADFIERRISDQFLNERISIRISEDSQYMYVFKDPQTFQFISLHDGKVKKSIKVPFEEYFPKLRFGEKEKFFVATDVFSGKIHKIDMDSGEVTKTVKFVASEIDITKDGKYLIAAPNGLGDALIVFDMETGKERIQSQSLSKNFDNFPNLGFFRLVANDTILAVGYMDDQFELWNLKSAKLIIRGRVPARNGNYLDFSKDGTRFSVLEDWGKRSYWDAIRLKRIVMKNDAEGHSFLELYDLIKQSQLLAPRCLFNIEREYLGLPAEQPEWCSRLKKVKH